MATNTLIPVSEYLSTSYSPDCDYIDGEIQERNVGETEHSDLQAQLIELLRSPENKLHVRATTELRVQVKPARFRVPDVCVRSIAAPKERIIRQPPLLCVEILSPEDRTYRTHERVRDFLEMGVREVWVIDTEARSVMVFAGGTMVEHRGGGLTVPETPVILTLANIFKVLDEY